MAQLVPEAISHYRIIRKLGAGGMGDVYLADDTKLNRRVAIKFLSDDTNQNATRRLLQEAQAAARLDHPNICAIHEIGEHDGKCFIVMQYVEGETLAKRIAAGALSIQQAVDVSIQITDALCEAHSHNIIHRDIKPQNIMITPKGLVRVLDFGLAKFIGERSATDTSAETASMMTAPGTIVGTLAYMSPEQLKGETLDHRTDLFSLGAVLYEIVSGRRAFWGETEHTTAAYILLKEPAALEEFVPQLPRSFESVIHKALAKDREARYQNATELLADLQAVQREIQTDGALRDAQSRSEQSRTVTLGPGASDVRTGQLTERVTDSRVEVSTATVPAGIRSLATRKTFLIAAVALLAIGGVAFVIKVAGPWGRAPFHSIAVLPFTDSVSDMEYMTDGLTEGLINRLSQLPDLKVIASSSVFQYKGQRVDPRAMRDALNVAAIVTGKVVQRGDNFTINVELVDTSDRSIISAITFTRSASEIVTLPGDMSRQISDGLRLKLSGDDAARLTRRPTNDAEAYRLYLQGRYFWNKRLGGAMRTAIEYFEKAIQIDPNYALAHAGLAESWVLGGGISAPPSEYMQRAKTAAEDALKLDDNLAEAHATLAKVKSEFEWQWDQAEAEFKRAIAFNPNYATAYEWYAGHLLAMGRTSEASEMLDRAYKVDPLSLSIKSSLGVPFLYTGQYDKAIEAYKRALAMDSNFIQGHFDLGIAYEMSGKHDEAIAEFQTVRAAAKRYYPALAMLGYCYAKQGKKSEAQKVLQDLIQTSNEHHISTYNMVVIYTGLGDVDKAIEWLRKGFEARAGYLISIKVDPLFASLRDHPGFKDLVSQMKLP